jgi:hypothetical protein
MFTALVVVLGLVAYGAAMAFSDDDATKKVSAPAAPLSPPPGMPSGTVIVNPCAGCPAPGFVSGIVQDRQGQTLVLQSSSSASPIRVRPAPAIQMGGTQSWNDINNGDQLSGTGEPSPDGSIILRIADVNVTQIRGSIAQVRPDGSWLIEPDSRPLDPSLPKDSAGLVRVQFDSNRPAVDMDGHPVTDQLIRTAKQGSQVYILGTRPPSDNSVKAVRLVSFTSS